MINGNTQTTATTDSSSSNQANMTTCLPFFINLFFIISVITIPCSISLSINFTEFGVTNQNIGYNGSASGSPTGIQLTRNLLGVDISGTNGRVIYETPMLLWNKAGEVADFTTNFSFVIDAQNRTLHGDGMTFFLASVGFPLPPTEGKSIGLALSNHTNTSSRSNSFVGVEFDTFQNKDLDDPPYNHVGININSMNSTVTKEWCNASHILHGEMNYASISYNSSSKNLSVAFTGFCGNATNLYYEVDLKSILPEFVSVGFSAETGLLYEIHTLHSWNFSSNLEVDEGKRNFRLVIVLSVSSCVVVGGLGLIWLVMKWKNRSREEEEEGLAIDLYMDDEFEKGTGPKKFSYAELVQATNNFDETEKLGEGGFGGVYKGFLANMNLYVAVKRVSKSSRQGVKEYASEVKIISRIRHRNLVKLVGWCHGKGELLLVYEFMSNGSLDFHLFKERSLLTWMMRYIIAQDLASAVLYLHEEWEQCVVHRDIKSSNVMLDSSFNAKLGDFGLARLVDHAKGSQTTIVAGTLGYMAPECAITGKSSKESDIYSFGVVALEIACGRKPFDPNEEPNRRLLVEWIWELYGMGNLHQAADPRLCGEFDELEIKNLMSVGIWCAHPDHNVRPSIREVIKVLKFEASLPILPSKMPVPVYCAPPMNTSTSSLLLSTGTSESGEGNMHSSYTGDTNSSEFTSNSLPSSTLSLLMHPA